MKHFPIELITQKEGQILQITTFLNKFAHIEFDDTDSLSQYSGKFARSGHIGSLCSPHLEWERECSCHVPAAFEIVN